MPAGVEAQTGDGGDAAVYPWRVRLGADAGAHGGGSHGGLEQWLWVNDDNPEEARCGWTGDGLERHRRLKADEEVLPQLSARPQRFGVQGSNTGQIEGSRVCPQRLQPETADQGNAQAEAVRRLRGSLRR